MINANQSGKGNKPTNPSRPLEQKQWVRRVREEGDREAFEKIFRTYYKRLHGFAYSYLGRAQDAEDVVQTVFLRIWSQKEDWDPPGTVKTYLFAAIRNEALNMLRHQEVVDETEQEVVRIFKELKNARPAHVMTLKSRNFEKKLSEASISCPPDAGKFL